MSRFSARTMSLWAVLDGGPDGGLDEGLDLGLGGAAEGAEGGVLARPAAERTDAARQAPTTPAVRADDECRDEGLSIGAVDSPGLVLRAAPMLCRPGDRGSRTRQRDRQR